MHRMSGEDSDNNKHIKATAADAFRMKMRLRRDVPATSGCSHSLQLLTSADVSKVRLRAGVRGNTSQAQFCRTHST